MQLQAVETPEGLIGTQMFDSAEDCSTTAGYWSAIIGEMRDAGTLAAVNGHSVERLVMAQVVWDRATAAVAREGAIRRIKARTAGIQVGSLRGRLSNCAPALKPSLAYRL
ncbi:hypothetical protein [Bradyrhizobium sp. 30]|uniref:hypothetical protein n=1 Tax=Bradyrhizobium sp. 30 TaxID=2782669 RepID=UPI001FF8E7B0|nr:hypothetical protein [Bradyrhizobium sp. 30]MCK1289928.1 hypothetical protein [Bradyrhizobium sp. 30]